MRWRRRPIGGSVDVAAATRVPGADPLSADERKRVRTIVMTLMPREGVLAGINGSSRRARCWRRRLGARGARGMRLHAGQRGRLRRTAASMFSRSASTNRRVRRVAGSKSFRRIRGSLVIEVDAQHLPPRRAGGRIVRARPRNGGGRGAADRRPMWSTRLPRHRRISCEVERDAAVRTLDCGVPAHRIARSGRRVPEEPAMTVSAASRSSSPCWSPASCRRGPRSCPGRVHGSTRQRQPPRLGRDAVCGRRGIELAARDLALVEDWDGVRWREQRGARFTDGATVGVRADTRRWAVNLTAATNLLNCGKHDARRADGREFTRAAVGREQPAMAAIRLRAVGASCSRAAGGGYLAVWVADDGREEDGDPLADAEADENSGHGIVRVRAEAFGPAGARRAIEAELVGAACPAGRKSACPAFVCNPGRNCAS